MGCAQAETSSIYPERLTTATGSLKVIIQNAHIEHQTTSVFKMDPYIIVKLSSYSFKTKVQFNSGPDPQFHEAFQFFINSCFMMHGRQLQLEMWDKNKLSDSQIGFGIVDMDPVIHGQLTSHSMRCFMNFERKEAGIVNLIAQFREVPSETLLFRFENATLRRKLRKMGNMNVSVRVTIGQEILETKPCKDSKESLPKWDTQVLTFIVPKIIKQGKVEVMDEGKLIGDFEIDLQEMLANEPEKFHSQDIFWEEKAGNDVIAGSVKFQTLYGVQREFSKRGQKGGKQYSKQQPAKVPKDSDKNSSQKNILKPQGGKEKKPMNQSNIKLNENGDAKNRSQIRDFQDANTLDDQKSPKIDIDNDKEDLKKEGETVDIKILESNVIKVKQKDDFQEKPEISSKKINQEANKDQKGDFNDKREGQSSNIQQQSNIPEQKQNEKQDLPQENPNEKINIDDTKPKQKPEKSEELPQQNQENVPQGQLDNYQKQSEIKEQPKQDEKSQQQQKPNEQQQKEENIESIPELKISQNEENPSQIQTEEQKQTLPEEAQKQSAVKLEKVNQEEQMKKEEESPERKLD